LQSYLALLVESQLPFNPWVAALAWLALFLANHGVAMATRAANEAQSLVGAEDWSILRRGSAPQYVLAKILFTGIVFLLAYQLGSTAFVFLGGGYIVAVACTVGLNTQGLLSARAMAQPNAGKGTVIFSTPLAFRHGAQRLCGVALACCIIGLALAHLALLGGALILGATAQGYLRRARKAERQLPTDNR
jgi:hypothetical protein